MLVINENFPFSASQELDHKSTTRGEKEIFIFFLLKDVCQKFRIIWSNNHIATKFPVLLKYFWIIQFTIRISKHIYGMRNLQLIGKNIFFCGFRGCFLYTLGLLQRHLKKFVKSIKSIHFWPIVWLEFKPE
jgi:hypothetical protein